MGMGMLFAGALAGGAKAADEIVDQAYKREEADRVRQQGLADRREAVLWEMKLKAEADGRWLDPRAPDGVTILAPPGQFGDLAHRRGQIHLGAVAGLELPGRRRDALRQRSQAAERLLHRVAHARQIGVVVRVLLEFLDQPRQAHQQVVQVVRERGGIHRRHRPALPLDQQVPLPARVAPPAQREKKEKDAGHPHEHQALGGLDGLQLLHGPRQAGGDPAGDENVHRRENHVDEGRNGGGTDQALLRQTRRRSMIPKSGHGDLLTGIEQARL